MLEVIKDTISTANTYGIPIPLLAIVIILYRVIIAKINWWPKREEYYNVMLTNLGNWREGLSIALEWYMEPGTEYNDEGFQKSKAYKICCQYSSTSQKTLKEKMHFGRVFLSKESTEKIDELFTEEWHLSNFDSLCTKDYLEDTLEIVSKTYQSILNDAQNDLAKNHKTEFFLRLMNNK